MDAFGLGDRLQEWLGYWDYILGLVVICGIFLFKKFSGKKEETKELWKD